MNFKSIIYTLILFILVSCDCLTVFEGKIIDKDTGMPIEGATVNLLEGEDIERTNSNGFFSVSTAYGGNCTRHPKVLITKEGYKSFQFELDHSGDYEIYKVKTETKYIDLSEPFYAIPNDTNSLFINLIIDKWSTDFATGDTLKIYLKRDDEKLEIEQEKEKIRKDWELHER